MNQLTVNEMQARGADEPVRRLLARVAPLAATPPADLSPAAAALAELAADLDYLGRWIDRLGDTSGMVGIHVPERGPRLMLVHRLAGQMSAVHDHGTFVAVCPVTGVETHRRYRRGTRPEVPPELVDVATLGAAQAVTLLPPEDVHDHGHLSGTGAPAYVLILTGDDQRRYVRHEWDLATGRHRTLKPGDPGRWTADAPWP